VLLKCRSALTDASGHFSISGLADGPTYVVAERRSRNDIAPSYGTRVRLSVVVPARGVRLVVARLGTVRIRILKPDGTPFVGEADTYAETEGGGGGGTHAISDGLAWRGALDDGKWLYRVTIPGYSYVEREFEIHDGDTVDLGDVTLFAGVDVTGLVLDSAGRPVKGASVLCIENDDRSTESDADGQFRFAHMPDERFSFAIEANGFATVHILRESRRRTPLEVRLPRWAHARIRVRDTSGSPVADASLEFEAEGQHSSTGAIWFRPSYGTTGDDGRVACDVPPGNVRIRRWTGPSRWQEFGFYTFIEGQTLDLDLNLPAK
jgi:hypothetical protein